jgi:hypothetical protein
LDYVRAMALEILPRKLNNRKEEKKGSKEADGSKC